jgi:hypothetical protein
VMRVPFSDPHTRGGEKRVKGRFVLFCFFFYYYY